MNKPLIGIMPLVDKEKESYWMLPGYMEGILQAGGISVMLPLVSDEVILEQLASEIDGFYSAWSTRRTSPYLESAGEYSLSMSQWEERCIRTCQQNTLPI